MTELLVIEKIKMNFQLRKHLFRSVTVTAVDDVSLRVKQGETLGIVGESGSGKTTLGRLSLRLLRPSAGRLLFNGEDITQTDETSLKAFRRRAQGIFQDPFSSIDPFMNIYQILEEPLLIHRIGNRDKREELIRETLEEIQLTPVKDFLTKYAHMLSGGQRQRVAIGRALILCPDYIVADEPVSMIDASSRVEVLHLCRELQEKHGTSFLYITHDIATARYFSDRIAVMYLGKVVETAPASKLVNQPRHPYTQALIAATLSLDPTNRFRERPVISGEPPSPINTPSGCRFHPRCPSFIPGKCEVTEPPMTEFEESHYTSCHLYS